MLKLKPLVLTSTKSSRELRHTIRKERPEEINRGAIGRKLGTFMKHTDKKTLKMFIKVSVNEDKNYRRSRAIKSF